MKLNRTRRRPTGDAKRLHSKLRQYAQDRLARRMKRAAHESDWDDAGLVEIWDDGFCEYPFCSNKCCN